MIKLAGLETLKKENKIIEFGISLLICRSGATGKERGM